MGLIISLGLTLALGYPYTLMHAALPFIALGKLGWVSSLAWV